MYKKITLFKVISDLFILWTAFYIAWWLRFNTPFFPGGYITSHWQIHYFWIMISLSPIYIFNLTLFDIYEFHQPLVPAQIIRQRFKGISLSLLICFALSFFIRSISFSRLLFILIWFLLTFFSICLHLLWNRLLPIPKVLAWISYEDRCRLDENISGNKSIEIKEYNARPELEVLHEWVDRTKPAQLLLIIDDFRVEELVNLSNRVLLYNCQLVLIPRFLLDHPLRLREVKFMRYNGLTIDLSAIKRHTMIIKRIIDIVGSILMLIVFSPILIMIVLALVFQRQGIFYRQIRVGLRGREFVLYKFTSMVKNAEAQTGPVWATENDPRVTALGRYLRSFSFDEVPQVWNVLRGDMSLIGPRPERPFFVQQFSSQWPEYAFRHLVKPGLTGWAQVNGLRGPSSVRDRLNHDLYYIYNFSWYLEFKIYVRTLLEFLFHKKAF